MFLKVVIHQTVGTQPIGSVGHRKKRGGAHHNKFEAWIYSPPFCDQSDNMWWQTKKLSRYIIADPLQILSGLPVSSCRLSIYIFLYIHTTLLLQLPHCGHGDMVGKGVVSFVIILSGHGVSVPSVYLARGDGGEVRQDYPYAR